MHRSRARDAAELEQLVAESQQGVFPCNGDCVAVDHPLRTGVAKYLINRLSYHLQEGWPCTPEALAHMLRPKGNPHGLNGGNRQSAEQRAATQERRRVAKAANSARNNAKLTPAEQAEKNEQRNARARARRAGLKVAKKPLKKTAA